MIATHEVLLFSRFFNAYTTGGVQKTGFFQSLDFTGYSEELDILQAVSGPLVDAYLRNEYSRRYTVSTWSRYMTWDKTNKRYNIDPDFYKDFAEALCGNLLSAESYYQLLQIDFSDLPDTIVKEMERDKRYTKTERGDDSRTADAYDDVTEYDNKTHTDTLTDKYPQYTVEQDNSYGITQTTETNTTSAYNSSNYEPDNKSVVDTTSHSDDLDTKYTAHDDVHETVFGAHKDETTYKSAEKVVTNTFGDIEVSADDYKDTDTTTIHKAEDREKLLRIQTELAQINAYKLIGDAVAATMCRADFDSFISHAGNFFPV